MYQKVLSEEETVKEVNEHLSHFYIYSHCYGYLG